MDKEQILIEIRQSIKYLLKEKEQGRDKFEISDFFKKNLVNEILNNFSNAISHQEYEDAVLEIFGQKRQKNISIPKGRIQKEVEKLIKQYRMRSKKKILQKLIVQFSPQADELPQINEYTTEVYNKLMKDPITRRITSLVKDGTTDLRRVLSVLSREGYDFDKDVIKKILDKAVLDSEKSKSKYSRGGRKAGAIGFDDPDSPVKKRLRQQMQKSLVRKARYRKQRFIRVECPKFKFELVDNTPNENDMRTIIYSGTRSKSNITVKTLLTGNRITDVQISCLKEKQKKGSVINVAEFQKSVANKEGDAFLQQWLKAANNQINFSNVQELIWFLMSILNDRFGLSEGLTKYLKDRFVIHLANLDKSLTQYVIEKALESL